jgi:hypothetical protein
MSFQELDSIVTHSLFYLYSLVTRQEAQLSDEEGVRLPG